ncbi:hypothetical protein HK104_010372 [Borealophlyctis nickersoniae]|nr:hypothetical protein HK104_010372 [Borealophlyctis nickersoniae]
MPRQTPSSTFPTTQTLAPNETAHLPSGSYEVWTVAGWHTHTLTFRRREKGQGVKGVVIVVPGNPGVIQYYETFMAEIVAESRGEVDVVAPQHLGHSTAISHDGVKYTLEDQIKHKVAFFDEVVRRYPAGTPIVLVGHSIGSYMAIQVLKARPKGVTKVIALFPTLQSMAVTPNGRSVGLLTMPILRQLAACAAGFMRTVLPATVFNYAVAAATGYTGRDLEITVQNFLYLASWEMAQVKELDTQTLEQHVDKIIFYYGQADGWCPMGHYEDMVRRFPNGEIYLCEDDVPHAFVVGFADVMGKKVGKWVQRVCSQQNTMN